MNASKSKIMGYREYHAAAKSLLSKHPKGTGLVTRGGYVFLLHGRVHFVDAGDTPQDAFEADEDGWSDAARIETESLQRAELVQLFAPTEINALEGASPKNEQILSQAQAEAVYSAMCALNNVGSTIKAKIPPTEDGGRWVFVEECEDSGQITLTTGLRTVARHSNQAAFASAYGLTHEKETAEPDDGGVCARGAAAVWLA